MTTEKARFRPTFWATFFTVPTLLILLGLGTWQLDRLQWKEALIAERQAGFAAAPTPLPANDAAAHGLLWRRVSVTGSFRHDQEIYLAARSMRGSPCSTPPIPTMRATARRSSAAACWMVPSATTWSS